MSKKSDTGIDKAAEREIMKQTIINAMSKKVDMNDPNSLNIHFYDFDKTPDRYNHGSKRVPHDLIKRGVLRRCDEWLKETAEFINKEYGEDENAFDRCIEVTKPSRVYFKEAPSPMPFGNSCSTLLAIFQYILAKHFCHFVWKSRKMSRAYEKCAFHLLRQPKLIKNRLS